MSLSTRPARVMVAVAAALLLAYVLVWLSVSNFDIGRSDFTAFYVGGTLLRGGHGAQLYNEAVQLPLHTALIAPDTEGNLPFVNSPVAAALVAPVTMLNLHLAYRIWGALELGLLILAVVIAVRSAPWPERCPRVSRLASRKRCEGCGGAGDDGRHCEAPSGAGSRCVHAGLAEPTSHRRCSWWRARVRRRVAPARRTSRHRGLLRHRRVVDHAVGSAHHVERGRPCRDVPRQWCGSAHHRGRSIGRRMRGRILAGIASASRPAAS